ncbi:MAG TPA: glycerol-3-phosphate dehydrogenase/oxidase [Bryobacteraceae bacterium]|jgi:glycerol-3-phosphate dehydrogenase|nr:glycerol-3-phosphate dehydrogenase/oxidase [Bryobacteraceae bacterium]
MHDRRIANIEKLKSEPFDVLIAGGGINGAGIARDLMLRDAGLRVALVEKNHFASGTSGKNSQLIHGGLRYLKYLDFHLVHEALRERATLLRIAGGLVEPLQFLIPCYGAIDRWFYGAGLMLYDLLAGKNSIGSFTSLSAGGTAAAEPGLAGEGLRGGLLFYDCRVNSARLVLENLLDAEARGAVIANYIGVEVNGDSIEAHDTLSGERFAIRARKIVDATGAWSSGAPLRLVRGSHLIFPRIHQGPEAIAYFDEQGRIVFLIPWGEAGELTLVGTTDVDHEGNADDVHISAEETSYLTSIVRRLFPAYRGEPVSSYSALRPLIAEAGRSATSTSREHKIWETSDGILHISGGKYTTYRSMSEELVDTLLQDLKPGRNYPCRTAQTPLDIATPPADAMERVRMAVEREYARKLPDLLYVSTYWGYERPLSPEWTEPLAREMETVLAEMQR